MEIIMNNRPNPEYEEMFNDLMQEVFGFTFEHWFEYVPWVENYESYSIIENGVMLANLCITKTEMILMGQRVQANQFGAIATRENARGRGLSRLLMEHVLSLYPDTLAYLSANPSVVDFYPRFGFRQVQTYKPVISREINNNPATAVKYEIDDVAERKCYSSIVDCTNTFSVNIFHMIMEYEDDIYFLPSCDAVVIARQDGERLFIADVIAQKPITFEQIAPELPFAGVKTVEFGFCPDLFKDSHGLDNGMIWEKDNMTPFFLRGDWNLPKYFRFPAMSET